jgi:hypothetical protein
MEKGQAFEDRSAVLHVQGKVLKYGTSGRALEAEAPKPAVQVNNLTQDPTWSPEVGFKGKIIGEFGAR